MGIVTIIAAITNLNQFKFGQVFFHLSKKIEIINTKDSVKSNIARPKNLCCLRF